MNRVVLTKEEGRWLSRNVIKSCTKLIAQAGSDPQVLSRTVYKTLSKILPQAQEITKTLEKLGEEPFDFEIMLEPKQRGVLRQLVDHTAASLEGLVIPEYERRALPTYKADAQRKLELLKALSRKLK